MKKLLTILILIIVLGILLNELGTFNPDMNKVTPQTTTPTTTENSSGGMSTYAPVVVDNTTNFLSSWTVHGSDANVSAEATFDKQDLKIVFPGSSLESAVLYRDGIPLIKGNKYVLTADVNSSIQRTMEVELKNADTGELYSKQPVTIQEGTKIKVEFTMDGENIWNGRLAFNLGSDGSEKCKQEHAISLSNIRFRNTTYSDNTVKVNQIGYSIYNAKKVVFPYNQGDMFDVVDVNTNAIVYTGAIVNGAMNLKTGETNYTGDFTNVLQPGKYRIEAQIVGTSYDFEIGTNLYTPISQELLKFFYFQRCAYELSPTWAFNLAHIACHDTAAIVYDDPTRVIDVNGGWHDAGDFGRYVQTGTKAVNDLMLAYYANPSFFGDNNGIPETGNGIPDVLDEARFELEWLMKMQADWGGVYNKAVTQGLPGDISPDEDNQRVYVLQVESATTADFISTMAIANVVYKDIDPAFAALCLEKAKISWDELLDIPNKISFENPEGFVAGNYRDEKDNDERYFAGMAMWYATHDKQYLEAARQIFEKDATAGQGTSWSDVGAYGSYLYLICPKTKEKDDFTQLVRSDFQAQADHILSVIQADGYQTSLENYSWGSNGFVANNGIHLMFAYDIFKDISYKQGAVEQVNYLFGKNALNMTFVSGYGQNSPVNVHSRLAKAKDTLLKGALVGGPDSDRDDIITSSFPLDTPPAKIYADNYLSYSSNEVAIYWNSALIYVLSRIE